MNIDLLIQTAKDYIIIVIFAFIVTGAMMYFEKKKPIKKCRYHKDCPHYQDVPTCNNDDEAIYYCGIAKNNLRNEKHDNV